MHEPMALALDEEPMLREKGEVVEQASLGDHRPTQTTFISTPATAEEAVGHPKVVGDTTFLAHAPGFSVIETGKSSSAGRP